MFSLRILFYTTFNQIFTLYKFLGQEKYLIFNQSFISTPYTQTDGLAERMMQKMEYIVRRFCAYGMEYKDHEGYTHEWVEHLPAVQLAYKISQHSTTGKSPSLVENGWDPPLAVGHLKKNLLTIHPTAKYFHDMCIAEAKEYNSQRYHKTHGTRIQRRG
ncbi:hypothetical protein O181_089584 [Austropuccinia psidii MF-1]|uniref:Integrase catalytic domain-containing protein n=1 Tax=Austropuccinia psidii MF-1 TaxID=1389203 RepID=A0A9Q3ITT8_9BASI|nr:hypothetical protein [Austropuccinia psidii MF-1]